MAQKLNSEYKEDGKKFVSVGLFFTATTLALNYSIMGNLRLDRGGYACIAASAFVAGIGVYDLLRKG